jgi:hypothetical protein
MVIPIGIPIPLKNETYNYYNGNRLDFQGKTTLNFFFKRKNKKRNPNPPLIVAGWPPIGVVG